jgi:hypothetical protein
MNRYCAFLITNLLVASCFFLFCKPKEDFSNSSNIDSVLFLQGKQLSVQLCGQCHLYPEPGLLDRYSWKQHVMPEMSNYYGYYFNEQQQYAPMTRDMVKSLDYLENIPEEPIIGIEQWHSMLYYYEMAAPETLPKTKDHFQISPNLEIFNVSYSPRQNIEPGVTMVKIPENNQGFWYADEGYGELRLVDAQMNIKRAIKIPGTPVGMTLLGDYWYVLTMGSFTPTNERVGSIFRIASDAEFSFERPQLVMDSLYRAVHITKADLNDDGLEDLLVCEFGSELGQLSWMKNTGDGKFLRKIISAQPGAVNAYPHDINGDGLMDVVALFGQAREGIFAFINKGHEKFEAQTLLQFPPTYGSTYFELTDFDGDGYTDILYAGGDHADYPENPPRLRPYHGIRIYKNLGDFSFEEKAFLHINGITRVMAIDSDTKGLKDIVAIAYFADFHHRPEESFVFLRQVSLWNFEAETIKEVNMGRWLVMDVGDINGDGKTDVVLGAAMAGFDTASASMVEQWQQNSRALAIMLQNTSQP